MNNALDLGTDHWGKKIQQMIRFKLYWILIGTDRRAGHYLYAADIIMKLACFWEDLHSCLTMPWLVLCVGCTSAPVAVRLACCVDSHILPAYRLWSPGAVGSNNEDVGIWMDLSSGPVRLCRSRCQVPHRSKVNSSEQNTFFRTAELMNWVHYACPSVCYGWPKVL